MGKEEIAHYEQFLLFPQCFQKTRESQGLFRRVTFSPSGCWSPVHLVVRCQYNRMIRHCLHRWWIAFSCSWCICYIIVRVQNGRWPADTAKFPGFKGMKRRRYRGCLGAHSGPQGIVQETSGFRAINDIIRCDSGCNKHFKTTGAVSRFVMVHPGTSRMLTVPLRSYRTLLPYGSFPFTSVVGSESRLSSRGIFVTWP